MLSFIHISSIFTGFSQFHFAATIQGLNELKSFFAALLYTIKENRVFKNINNKFLFKVCCSSPVLFW